MFPLLRHIPLGKTALCSRSWQLCQARSITYLEEMKAKRYQILVTNLPTFMSTNAFWDFVNQKTVGVSDVKMLIEDSGPVVDRCALVSYKRRVLSWDAEKVLNKTRLKGNNLRASRVLETELIQGDMMKLRAMEDRETVRTFKSERMCYIPNRYLYVSNISPNTTYDNLLHVFRKYGKVVDLKLKERGDLRYAHVGYANLNESLNAFIKLQGLRMRKRLLFVSYMKRSTAFKERGTLSTGRLKLSKSPIFRIRPSSKTTQVKQLSSPESGDKKEEQKLSNLIIPKQNELYLPGIKEKPSSWKSKKAIDYSGDNFLPVRSDFKVYRLAVHDIAPTYDRKPLHSLKKLPPSRQIAKSLRKKVP